MTPTVEEYVLASMQPSSAAEAAVAHSRPAGGGGHDGGGSQNAIGGHPEGAAFVVDRSRPSIFRKVISRLATLLERRPMTVPLSPTTRYNANSRREYRKESLYIRPIRLSGNLLRAGLDIFHAPDDALPSAAAPDGGEACCYVLVAFVDCSDATVATLVNGKGRIVDSRLLERGFKQRIELAISAKELPSPGTPPRTFTVHIQQQQSNSTCAPCEWCASPGWCACEASCEGGVAGGHRREAPTTPSRGCDGATLATPKGMERGRRMPLPSKESPPMQVSILRVTSHGAAGAMVRDVKKWPTLRRAQQGADCEGSRCNTAEAFDVALVEQRLIYGERDFGILEVYGQKADEEGSLACSSESALKAKVQLAVNSERVQESSSDADLFVADERGKEKGSGPPRGGPLAASIVGGAGESCLTIAMVEREYERDNADCVICLTNARDTLLLPCRHMCICIECADTLGNGDGKCPLCRQTYASMITIKDEGATTS